MRHKLRTLEKGRPDYQPPLGLAARTCESIFCCGGVFECEPPEFPTASRRTSAADLCEPAPAAVAGRGGWRPIDVAAAAGIVAAAVLLILPAVANSRFEARIAACQNNLRQIGLALTEYSGANQGYFPPVPTKGPLAAAGVYAPTLVRAGYLPNPRVVICPCSPLAEADDFEVPAIQQLVSADPRRLRCLQRQMGGSYGYAMGYVEGGHYRANRNLARFHFAVLSDAPCLHLPDFQSDNHGGRGQNVLFEDGHVVFLTKPQPTDFFDHFFLNDTGFVAAGRRRDDSVIGSSGTSPLGVPLQTVSLDGSW